MIPRGGNKFGESYNCHNFFVEESFLSLHMQGGTQAKLGGQSLLRRQNWETRDKDGLVSQGRVLERAADRSDITTNSIDIKMTIREYYE